MFYDDPRCVQIAPRIYKFENIIPKEIYDPVFNVAKDFERHSNPNLWSVRDWYADKMSPPFKETFPLWKFMSELIYPEIVIHPVRNMMVAGPGDEGMFIHTDSPGKGNCDLLLEIDQWSTCCELEYGMIAYFGDFTGGELYYPNINPDGTEKTGDLRIDEAKLAQPCLVVPVKAGDIVLHGACAPYDHGTMETLSGTRFAFSTFALLAEDNPGTFNNYKSPEWEEQIGKYEDPDDKTLNEWNSPFRTNPQFADMITEKVAAQDKLRFELGQENSY